MGVQAQGVLIGLLGLASAILAGPPDNFLAAGLLLAASFYLSRFEVALTPSIVFSPATPIALGSAMVPEVGPSVVLVTVLASALAATSTPFLEALGRSGALLGATLVSVACHLLRPDQPILPLLLAPTVYVLFQLGLVHNLKAPENRDELALWYRVKLRIRPLEAGLAMASPLVYICVQIFPPTCFLLVPMMLVGVLAAENVLLLSHDERLEEVVQELQQTTHLADRQKASLSKERTEKQLLEGFTTLLSQKPGLSEVGQSLVKTVIDLFGADNVCLFVGKPPEPFAYECEQEIKSRVQGSALTGLREPTVDRAFAKGQVIHQKKDSPGTQDRLFEYDASAVVLPVGEQGVLYVGRRAAKPFPKEEIKTLRWLAQKAEVALNFSLEEQRARNLRKHLTETVQTLETKMAWMDILIQVSERLSSTLQSSELLGRMQQDIQQRLPHDAGQIRLISEDDVVWGTAPSVPNRLLELLSARNTGLRLASLPETPYAAELPGFQSFLGAPIKTSGDVLGWVVLLRTEPRPFSAEEGDFLFLVATQAAMAFSNSKLYEDVVEARQQLEESQAHLIQSSKMGAMGQLAAGVAHELNSPLGAISLSLEESIRVLSTQPVLAEQMLGVAQEAVERGKAIVNRLMGYSRSPEGRVENIELKELLLDTADFLAPQMRELEVSIILDEVEISWVKAERQPLQQVFVNLLLNGAQAMEKAPSDARVVNLKTKLTPSTVQVLVCDRGSGIGTDVIDRIFDPFFTTKDVGRGTGLGLWVCHQITKDLDGKLEVVSTSDEGTVFGLTLDLIEPSE